MQKKMNRSDIVRYDDIAYEGATKNFTEIGLRRTTLWRRVFCFCFCNETSDPVAIAGKHYLVRRQRDIKVRGYEEFQNLSNLL